MSDAAPCPDCNGVGYTLAFVDGTRNGKRFGMQAKTPCSLCAGNGALSRERWGWITEGRRLRALRLARGMDAGAAAEALGVPLRTLLSCEQGRIDPAHLTQAAAKAEWM